MKRAIIIIIAALMALPTISMADNKPAKKSKGEIKEVTFEKGVKDLKVTLEDKTVALKYDAAKTTETALKTSIEKLGYPVKGVLAPGQKAEHNHEHHDHDGHDHGHHHHHN